MSRDTFVSVEKKCFYDYMYSALSSGSDRHDLAPPISNDKNPFIMLIHHDVMTLVLEYALGNAEEFQSMLCLCTDMRLLLNDPQRYYFTKGLKSLLLPVDVRFDPICEMDEALETVAKKMFLNFCRNGGKEELFEMKEEMTPVHYHRELEEIAEFLCELLSGDGLVIHSEDCYDYCDLVATEGHLVAPKLQAFLEVEDDDDLLDIDLYMGNLKYHCECSAYRQKPDLGEILNSCESCSRLLCQRCVKTCSFCGMGVCRECFQSCLGCGESGCSDCFMEYHG